MSKFTFLLICEEGGGNVNLKEFLSKVDQDYTMDGESYSSYEDEPLGEYLDKEGYWE